MSDLQKKFMQVFILSIERFKTENRNSVKNLSVVIKNSLKTIILYSGIYL